MKVVWTDRARRHLRAIHDYIAQDSPAAATRMVDRLTRKSQFLASFPRLGHVVPEYEADVSAPTVRQLIEGNYRIVYRVTPNRVEVIAVVHGARQLPSIDEFSE